MSAREILNEAKSKGIEIWADGTALRCLGDEAILSAMVPKLKARKPELLRLLTGKPIDLGDATPSLRSDTILPPPWDAIRDRIQQGWRAEFGPPGTDGRQAITWRPPGTWTPEPAPAPPLLRNAEPVRCCDCAHQEPTDHRALVRCKAGVQALEACMAWWSTDRHLCGRFEGGES